MVQIKDTKIYLFYLPVFRKYSYYDRLKTLNLPIVFTEDIEWTCVYMHGYKHGFKSGLMNIFVICYGF